MSSPKVVLPWVALASILFLGCPLGPFSGGHLGGEVQTGPVTDWSFVADVENCQLETNPEAPHSINCWCAGYQGNVYVPSSMILGPTDPTEREWVQNVQRDPAVRLRVDGRVYERKAVRVDDDAEYDAVLAALEEKYELDPNEREDEREIWLYRLEAR
jgi:hypothetical protein